MVDEDELTEWLGSAVTPEPATGTEPATGRSASREHAAAPARRGRPAAPPPAEAKHPGRRWPRARVAVWTMTTALVIGALATVAVRLFAQSASRPPTAAQLGEEAAARNDAAAWVAQHVSRNAIVACDKVTCAALTAHGFPEHELRVLGPTSADPVTSAVVVQTAAVKDLFGSSLATAWAPAVLASFGSGAAAITVRVIAPHGAGVYKAALDADLAARKINGPALLNDPQITVSKLAGDQLTAGQVDSRLVLALADLAARQPISIMRFGNDGPGASAGIPLRFVDLSEDVQAADLAPAAHAKSVRDYLVRRPSSTARS